MQITTGKWLDTCALGSPDGERILFQSNRGGAEGLWTMDPDGGEIATVSCANCATP